jgi:hypothetical protein
MLSFRIIYVGKEAHLHLNGKWILRLVLLFVFWSSFGLASAGLRFFHFGLPELVATIQVKMFETELLSQRAIAQTLNISDEKVALCEAHNKQLVTMIDDLDATKLRKLDGGVGGEEPKPKKKKRRQE